MFQGRPSNRGTRWKKPEFNPTANTRWSPSKHAVAAVYREMDEAGKLTEPSARDMAG